ncbi:MAG: D-glycero-beta-D-manno-heptose 1-phosphate adenylyltransferase [Desulfobacterota bacterium]|nr:D-glycero-beta-D-manno-heptose 1-phosphate adenylyltransferase [Thermodesulfobacteriota bacterium]
MKEKIKGKEELKGILQDLKAKGKRVVFTNGCFDLLHAGHIRYLEQARALGDVLVVGLNTDRSVQRIKGPLRPILPEEVRAEILSGLWCVDFITLFDEPTPFTLIDLLRPDILVKGGDYTKETIVGREVVEASGGKVIVLPLTEGWSTSAIIETILKRHEKKS